MSVKIIHSADFHLDSPFDSLPEKKALERRQEQRALLGSLADLAESEQADVVLLSGDLFDSSVCYYETCETLLRVLSSIKARVFISPGNHDFYCDRSPYSILDFPENVHIFRSPVISSVELPDLGCRVYGAAFTSSSSRPLLRGFTAEDDGLVNLMVLHGDLADDRYNLITRQDIERSGLDYLALGHIHAYSGICSAGSTVYAYPGCTEGRGFDETGEKGVIAGTVSKGGADLRFIPLRGRQYRIVQADVSGSTALAAAEAAISESMKNDVVRVVLRGGTDEDIDCTALAESLADSAYHVTVRDETHALRDIWDGVSEDTLRGGFLRFLREKYDSADENDKPGILLAVRYGLAALDNREEWGA